MPTLAKKPRFHVPTSPDVTSKPHPIGPTPLLRLEIRDLRAAGSAIFLSQLDSTTVLSAAVNGVLNLLYPPHSAHIPPTRSVTLVLRSMDGVAYTTGTELDSDHKEIHFSTDYIGGIKAELRKSEMLGVLRHEMVHCFQWDALGTCPGGLIEGVADWVRLRSGLVPPHWTREPGDKWDAGYQHTGYFLDYLEERFGDGCVMAVNEKLRGVKYEEDVFWKELFGVGVEELWGEYKESMKSETEGAEKPVPSCAPGGEKKVDIEEKKEDKEEKAEDKEEKAEDTESPSIRILRSSVERKS